VFSSNKYKKFLGLNWWMGRRAAQSLRRYVAQVLHQTKDDEFLAQLKRVLTYPGEPTRRNSSDTHVMYVF
jgi:hypothetical protein